MPRPSYYRTLTAAISDLARHGFDSETRLREWQRRLRDAAEASLPSEADMSRMLQRSLDTVWKRTVERGGLQRLSPGVTRFTVQQLTPQMRTELQKRILVSADLIKLNRAQAIDKTLQRFSGWATSVPKGGSRAVNKRKIQETIAKPVKSSSFEARRVATDQGHKLIAAVNEIVAQDGGAIAARWHSQWKRPGYDYREPHKERDNVVYLIRGSWAQKAGLVKPGDAGYTDQITQPAEEPYCSCAYEYLYNLRDIPQEMWTEKGHNEMKRVREMIANAG